MENWMTKLVLFKGNSAFRTWLYRIVVNEFLQTKRRAKEDQFTDFNDFSNKLDGIPESLPTPQEELELKEFTRRRGQYTGPGDGGRPY